MNARLLTPRTVNVRKATGYAVVVNSLQIAFVAGFAVYLCLTDAGVQPAWLLRVVACVSAAMASWGAVIDIREAVSARRTSDALTDLEATMAQVEQLNLTLRAQRHDFLNHLQVVYSLMEMKEYGEAGAYIERIYGDIRSVSSMLRTGNAAVNALLNVKLAACESRGITVTLDIKSAFKDLPMPGWEMCRVLGNLIDNAVDALRGTPSPRLLISLSEDLRSFRFAVANNGPAVPRTLFERIFLPGVTTKSVGHGMGLAIVRDTLRAHGGDITLSQEEQVVFMGFVPKPLPAVDAANGHAAALGEQESVTRN